MPRSAQADTAEGVEAAWLAACAERATAGAQTLADALSQWRVDANAGRTARAGGTRGHAAPCRWRRRSHWRWCAAPKTDTMAARVLALAAWRRWAVHGRRSGLVAQVAAALGDGTSRFDGGGTRCARRRCRAALRAACRSTLLQIDTDSRALPEAPITVPLPVVFALTDTPRLFWHGLRMAPDPAPMQQTTPLPPAIRAAAAGACVGAGAGLGGRVGGAQRASEGSAGGCRRSGAPTATAGGLHRR